MIYDAYRYLWPPRPEKAIPAELIQFYAGRGWQAQVKKNGTCTVIFVHGSEVTFRTRHDTEHAQWSPRPEHTAALARSGWHVYVAELLHNKTPHIKDTLYLFDVLVSHGVELVGRPFVDRQNILLDRFPGKGVGFGAVEVAPLLWRACPVAADPGALANLAPEDEGFVLKNPKAPLEPCTSGSSNNGWQVKCRRPHPNYSF